MRIIVLLFCLAFLNAGCTLLDYEIENRNWEEELPELRKADSPWKCKKVICLSQTYRNRPGFFTEDEFTVKKALADAPFTITEGDPNKADLFALIRAYEQGAIHPTFMITLVTLGLWPYRSDRTLTVEITLVDPKGVPLRVYQRRADYEIWMGVVFLFWPPGWIPPRLVKKWVFQDLTRDMIREMYEDKPNPTTVTG